MQGSNSSLFIEQLIREVVRDLDVFTADALGQVGYYGPHQRIALTAEQDAFLAGYLHGAVVRMIGFGEQITDRDVERAADGLHRALFGAFEMAGRMRHATLVREGLDHFRNPQVYLGYAAGHQDALRLLQHPDFRSTLGSALVNLGAAGTVASSWN